MSYIRYPMIPPRRLPILFMEPILKEHGHFFIDKMTETMYYNMIKIGMVFEIILLTFIYCIILYYILYCIF
jgi:hypothetical protein